LDNTKVDSALKIITNFVERFKNSVYLAHSGGKDSVVIHHLTKQIKPDIMIIHNVKPMLGTV